ncbi:MAG: histidine kinase [Acidobacteria bacterium]|nr:MAG: histidine kinase [Acidobacteriota bacterium]
MFRKLRRQLASLFLAALLFLIGNAIISFWSLSTLYKNNSLVIHTLDVLEKIETVRADITSAESNQRGFLLTDNTQFLEPYERAVQDVEPTIDRLAELTSDNPAQQKNLVELRPSIVERIRLLRETLNIRRDSGLDGVTSGGTLERGRVEMDKLLDSIANIEQIEKNLLAARTEQSRQSSINSILTLSISNLVSIALVIFVFYLIKRDVAERDKEERLLREANETLEARVAERTAELAGANLELERSNRELQDFAFVASHDLQEPLRKIQAFGDRLRTVQAPKFDDQGRDYLDRMHSAAGRMHKLINDLLTFSRVTTKAQPFETIDLNMIARDVLSDLETTIEQSGGTVEVGDLPSIDADAMQMRQLFQNLIVNALKFRKPESPPVVKVEAELVNKNASGIEGSASNTFARITVADNGIGFDEKYLDRIFTPFQRLHGRNEYEGTGIGLAVCRKIVERHGGSLTAQSSAGNGATFIATMPVAQNKEKK